MADKNKKSKKVTASSQKKTTSKAAPAKVVKKKVVVKKQVKAPVAESPAPVKVQKPKETLKVKEGALYATGRRKESTAKVWMFQGTGVVKINHLDPLEYLSSERLVSQVLMPLNLLNLTNKYDVRIDVIGGGLTGQADASMLGLSRAVLGISDDFKATLRANGLLTQDRREKERKKYGKRGARKSPQFRKR